MCFPFRLGIGRQRKVVLRLHYKGESSWYSNQDKSRLNLIIAGSQDMKINQHHLVALAPLVRLLARRKTPSLTMVPRSELQSAPSGVDAIWRNRCECYLAQQV